MLIWTGFIEMKMVRNDQTQPLIFIDCVHVHVRQKEKPRLHLSRVEAQSCPLWRLEGLKIRQA